MDNKLSKIVVFLVMTLTIVIFVITKNYLFGHYLNFKDDKLLFYYLIFIFSYSFSLLLSLPFIRVIENIYIKTKEDIIKEIDFDYFREVVDNYSIATLYYCYSKKVNFNDYVMANILKLELEKKIEIDNNTNIRLLKEKELTYSEFNLVKILSWDRKYSLKYLRKGLKKDIIMDASKSDLFYDDFSKIRKWIVFLEKFGVALWLINFIFIIFGFFVSYKYVLFMMVYHFIALLVLLLINKYSHNILIKNEKGILLKRKLVGLKKYLCDFGSISDKRIDDIKLWDYYIIYAILFDIKGVLNKEVNDSYLKVLKAFRDY